MTANLNKMAASAAKYFFWAQKNGVYPYGATGTIANGSDAGMPRHKGLSSINFAFPEATREAILGDGGKMGEFLSGILEASAATLTFNVLDQDYEAATRSTLIYADGDHDATIFSTQCVDFNDLCAVININAKAFDSGVVGQKGWLVIELWDYQDSSNLLDAISGVSYAPVPNTHSLSLDEVSTEISGLAVSSTNYGVTQGTIKWYWSENPVHYHTHLGDGLDTTLTLNYTPAASNGNKIKLWQNGTAKTYTTHYTASGTTLTFVAAPTAGMVSIIKYEFTDAC